MEVNTSFELFKYLTSEEKDEAVQCINRQVKKFQKQIRFLIQARILDEEYVTNPAIIYPAFCIFHIAPFQGSHLWP